MWLGVASGVGLASALVAWAWTAGPNVRLPSIEMPGLGAAFMLLGATLFALGQRVHRLTNHPVPLGAGSLVLGAALVTGSASGLWLVTAIVLLTIAAHVAIRRSSRFDSPEPLLRLPPSDEQEPTPWARWSVVIFVFVPWTLAYEAAFLLGIPSDGIEASFPFEREWPVLVWTEAIYTSIYVIVLVATFSARANRVLRHLALTALTATVVVPFIYVTVPVISPPRPFTSTSTLGVMLQMERDMSHTAAAFPAFHVIWTLIAAEALAATHRRWAVAVWLWALAVSISCITTGMHAIADVMFALLLWPVLGSYRRIAEVVNRPPMLPQSVRATLRSLLPGVAAALGVWVASSLAGPAGRTSTTWGIAVAWLAWAIHRWWPAVLRRAGTRSMVAMAAGGAGSVAMANVVGDPWLLALAAGAVAAPWMHGALALRDYSVGLRPGWSLLGYLAIGVLLARMWKVGAALGVVAGLYFILDALLGVVTAGGQAGERAQSRPHITSLVQLALGIVLTTIPSGSAPDSSGWLAARSIIPAAVMGLATTAVRAIRAPGAVLRATSIPGD